MESRVSIWKNMIFSINISQVSEGHTPQRLLSSISLTESSLAWTRDYIHKAFDTVNHAIMSNKLGAIGCDDGSVNRLNSYLIIRSQFIDIKGILSDRGEVTCGVLQGSILGPLL